MDALGDTKLEDMAEAPGHREGQRRGLPGEHPHEQVFDTQVCGPQVFYMAGSEAGKRLAECIQARLNGRRRSGSASRSDGYYLLKSVEATAVIVECGLSNPQEENFCKIRAIRRNSPRLSRAASPFVSGEAEGSPDGSEE